MIELQPFTENDFRLFKTWIKDEEQMVQFGGEMFVFPVTDEQLKSYIHNDNIKPLKVIWKETSETIGHCELNYQDGNKRLSRILIGEDKWRGKKIGEQIVLRMVELFFKDPNTKKVDLNVFDWNKGAIKCYQNVGFEIKHDKTTLMKVGNKTWTRLNMELERK
ncbi:GNAT family protein [Bernardetia sp. ABR2-2B]|uniref:GNAT family N-acetyltransferase n=1 Tax=Bernardetia sp. ABR2-2B TaxID=3127472 RepID=UPI0030CDD315